LSSKKTLRITFTLPGASTAPGGGDKVVFEYANYLAGKGHKVSILFPAFLVKGEKLIKPNIRHNINTARAAWKSLKNRATGNYKPTAWFDLSPSVNLRWVPSLAARYVPNGDIVFAGAWQTAEWVASYPPSKGKKFYLIQHLETWAGEKERVMTTWKLPLQKITIARWLQKIAEDLGEKAHLVHNGLDFTRFKMTTPHEDRDPHTLLMLYSSVEWKGSAQGIAAFEIARTQEPALKLKLFGTHAPPEKLPPGVEYFRNPPQQLLRDLHNQTAIFVSPSWTEGFPLPPAEALQCGETLVSTDIDGTAMYAFNEETALLSPIKDPQALAANILRAVRDRELRLRLARNGHAKIQEFTWEKAGSSLESILLNAF
jgi:glycosyltransferase involved in cell wall biosynthesis